MSAATGRLVRRAFGVEPGEEPIVLWSAAYFFCVLASNYVLRSLRDALGSGGDQERLFLGTFTVMLLATPLYGWMVARLPRRWFVPLVYRFFLVNVLVFWLVFRARGLGGNPTLTFVFFVWHAVFNLFAVSVFWSVMADVFGPRQGRRLFGAIGMVGTLGALSGALLTSQLANRLPRPEDLLVIAMITLELAAFCGRRVLDRHVLAPVPASGDASAAVAPAPTVERGLGGGILAGIRQAFATPFLAGISVYMILSTMTATFVYVTRQGIVAAEVKDVARRAELFGQVDAWTQGLTALTQGFATRRVLRWLGVGLTLCIVPLVSFVGLGALSFAPLLAVAIAVDVIRRASAFSLEVPARGVLFTVTTRTEKYKAKGFIDTVIYRGGDYVGAALFKGLVGATGSPANACLATSPVALLFGGLGWFLGREQRRREAQRAPGAEGTESTGRRFSRTSQ